MQIDKKTHTRLQLLLILLTLLVAFSFQGSRGLYETTEGRYAECAREMVEGGNYLEPTLGYRPHWTKPPMTYWAIAGGMKVLGMNEWGVRLYNSIAFLLTTLVVAGLGATLWNRVTGSVAGLIYVTSVFPALGSFAVSTDTLLTLWEICAVFCYLKAFNSPGLPGRRWIVGMWFFFGLGFLTKGPSALLPLLPIVVWHFRQKERPPLATPSGILLFFIVGFYWYVLVCFRHPELFRYFLGQEIVARVTSSSVHNYEWYKPFVVYLPVLTLGAGPWLYFGLKIFFQEGLGHPSQFWKRIRGHSFSAFLLLWLLLPLIVFTVVRSRLHLYVLPLYAPIALATARGLCKQKEYAIISSRIAAIAVICALGLTGIKGIVSIYPAQNNMRILYKMCQKVGSSHSDFTVFDQHRLYGLQFYLHGKLRRISLTGRESWADGSISDFINKTVTSTDSPVHVLITLKKRAPDLARILGEARISSQTLATKYWTLFVTSKAKLEL